MTILQQKIGPSPRLAVRWDLPRPHQEVANVRDHQDPSTSHLELEVVASSGVVSIRGRLTSAEEIKDIERVASAVTGVMGLNLGQVAPSVHA
jgi:hypothetical protein